MEEHIELNPHVFTNSEDKMRIFVEDNEKDGNVVAGFHFPSLEFEIVYSEKKVKELKEKNPVQIDALTGNEYILSDDVIIPELLFVYKSDDIQKIIIYIGDEHVAFERKEPEVFFGYIWSSILTILYKYTDFFAKNAKDENDMWKCIISFSYNTGLHYQLRDFIYYIGNRSTSEEKRKKYSFYSDVVDELINRCKPFSTYDYNSKTKWN